MSEPDRTPEDRELEHLAMNIVFQIGDALYDVLPKDVAHDYFVDARQKTNDVAIDFAKKLIKADRKSLSTALLEKGPKDTDILSPPQQSWKLGGTDQGSYVKAWQDASAQWRSIIKEYLG